MKISPGCTAYPYKKAMDESRFLEACREALAEGSRPGGIGVLGEKSLHAALKRYLESREACREVLVGRYVADIVNERGITEIQTAGFGRLREKLAFFLPNYPVTLVYPVAAVKWLISVGEDGALSRRRRSPKTGGAWEMLTELYSLRDLLKEPGLSLCAMLLEVEEYRLKDGRGRRGYTRWERMPVRLLEEVWAQEPREFPRLLPPDLPAEFTAKDFQTRGRFSKMSGSLALTAARELGAVERVGSRGRAYLYRVHSF